jgi:hypothetical protein
MNVSFTELAKNFLTSAAAFAKSGFQLTPVEVLEDRLKICHACEHFDIKWYAGTGKCGKCQCSIEAKLRMASSYCPVNKWGSVDK